MVITASIALTFTAYHRGPNLVQVVRKGFAEKAGFQLKPRKTRSWPGTVGMEECSRRKAWGRRGSAH